MQYGHIYISPHLDDVVLSCGGQIWQQTQMGENVLVVTVFADGPEPSLRLSPFAQELHSRWQEPGDAAAARRLEDIAAVAKLGARAFHWPYTDCIYRQIASGEFPYASEASLWGPIHPEEKHLVERIQTQLESLPGASSRVLYAPLSVGDHVDHKVVRRAVESLHQPILFYEDFPYAQDRQSVHRKLGGEDWRPKMCWLSEQALGAKATAIASYRSQISTFWTGIAGMSASIRAFALQVGQVAPAERYWRPA